MISLTPRIFGGGCSGRGPPGSRPETGTRAAIGHASKNLILRPDGQSELYDLTKDPQELHNAYREQSYASTQSNLEGRILNWYIRTSDVAPRQLDPRGFPAQHTF
jgi:hypothetical protein